MPSMVNTYKIKNAGKSEYQEDYNIGLLEESNRYSYEYSQNVEAESSGSSEIKYLLGEPIDMRAFKTPAGTVNSKNKTVQ